MICGHYRESFAGHDESPKLAAKMAKGMPRWPPEKAGGRKASDPLAQKAWQTGKLNFFSDATTMAVCPYSAN
jgi:hypothetical protein